VNGWIVVDYGDDGTAHCKFMLLCHHSAPVSPSR
jgi:hypothetical protein